jgi:hypothetical protein
MYESVTLNDVYDMQITPIACNAITECDDV